MRRARPSLGTLVEMRVEGIDGIAARRAIDAAFAEVAAVHRLMSFHEPDSDLSRLHRAPVGTRISVDARTHAVLACALRVARAARGVFDPTIAARLVEGGTLPRPDSPFEPDPTATWRDIELLDDDRVCLQRRLWIDLGGIAKGYAVDRAIEVLQARGVTQACVNAGGDLRVAGARTERVHVRDAFGGVTEAVDVADGAIASSTSSPHDTAAQHWHGGDRSAIHGAITATVVAPRCMIADALTKIVLAQGSASAALLARYGARARVQDPWRGWSLVGAAA
jgi:thiamine biosynthesis lipoprotein